MRKSAKKEPKLAGVNTKITNKNKQKQIITNKNKKKTKSDFVVYKEKEKEKEEEKEKVKEKEKIYNSLADAVREFNSQLSEKLPMVVTFNDKRKQKLSARWHEFEKIGEPGEVWQKLIDIIKNSKFLLGEAGEWKCSFDWLIENSTNWLKVYEGHYNNNSNTPKGTAFQGGTYNERDWN